VGVSTLEVLANNIICNEKIICPIIDARRDRVYTAIYQGENELGLRKEKVSEQMLEVEDLTACLEEKFSDEIFFIGEAIKDYGNIIKEKLGARVDFLPATHNLIRGGVLGRIGYIKLRSGETDDLLEVKPNYMKRSQAEIDWEKKGSR
jgi:tRNA threonylcarbamoyladenosine biosynthesis protein TsaB